MLSIPKKLLPSALRLPSMGELEKLASSKELAKVASALNRADHFLAVAAPQANRLLGTSAPTHVEAQSLFGWGKNDREKFIEGTADFRKTAGDVSRLSAELSRLDPADPRYAQVSAQLKTAEDTLKARYGYDAKTLPKPGTLWVDPQFLGKELVGGQVKADHFRTGTPVTSPPAPLDVIAARGRPYKVRTADGQLVELKTPEEYKAFVAANRAASGLPRTDGEPLGVQVNFEGGGGKGKRYGAALAELAAQGVVPTSVGGSSAGAIGAALTAAGADPEELNRIVTDPQLGKLFDIDILHPNGGLADGKAAFDFLDQKLRELTGIKDRPVTFADLKIPLQIYATKMSDSKLDPGTEDLTKVANRLFVFSQETTPNTPVALAVRASMAIPAAFDPVQMVDPMTGREIQLVDGGVLDNLPMGHVNNGLPAIGLSLLEKGSNHPNAGNNTRKPEPLPSGNIDAGNILLNGYYGKKMNDASAANADDFRNRTQPREGEFMIGLPVWNLEDPSQQDSTFGFGYTEFDPIIDRQTRDVVRNFLRQDLGQFGQPGARGTNLSTQIPPNLQFTAEVRGQNGKTYVASYGGGDQVSFQEKGGSERFALSLGKQKIEAMYLDNLAFGDMAARLADEMKASGRGMLRAA